MKHEHGVAPGVAAQKETVCAEHLRARTAFDQRAEQPGGGHPAETCAERVEDGDRQRADFQRIAFRYRQICRGGGSGREEAEKGGGGRGREGMAGEAVDAGEAGAGRDEAAAAALRARCRRVGNEEREPCSFASCDTQEMTPL